MGQCLVVLAHNVRTRTLHWNMSVQNRIGSSGPRVCLFLWLTLLYSSGVGSPYHHLPLSQELFSRHYFRSGSHNSLYSSLSPRYIFSPFILHYSLCSLIARYISSLYSLKFSGTFDLFLAIISLVVLYSLLSMLFSRGFLAIFSLLIHSSLCTSLYSSDTSRYISLVLFDNILSLCFCRTFHFFATFSKRPSFRYILSIRLYFLVIFSRLYTALYTSFSILYTALWFSLYSLLSILLFSLLLSTSLYVSLLLSTSLIPHFSLQISCTRTLALYFSPLYAKIYQCQLSLQIPFPVIIISIRINAQLLPWVKLYAPRILYQYKLYLPGPTNGKLGFHLLVYSLCTALP